MFSSFLIENILSLLLFLVNLLLDKIELHLFILLFNFLLVCMALNICNAIVLQVLDRLPFSQRLHYLSLLLRDVCSGNVLQSHVPAS